MGYDGIKVIWVWLKVNCVLCCFLDVIVGIYVIVVFYDLNNNKKMDMNFLGFLKEVWGVFGNVCLFMCVL